MLFLPVPLLLLLLPLSVVAKKQVQVEESPRRRDIRHLPDPMFDSLGVANDPRLEEYLDWKVEGGLLKDILIPRAPGTDNNTYVQKRITQVFDQLGWHVETDRFTWSTPYGDKEFTNLIYTFDPTAPRRIVLSAHHDSKFYPTFPDNQFIGATDSAVPVSILVSVAAALTPLLRDRQTRLKAASDKGERVAVAADGFNEEEAARTTLQIVLFDGEEAFKDWTDTDSTYGSRHLAELWSKSYTSPPHPPSPPPSPRRYSPSASLLTSMDALVLLDLLGAPDPQIQSYYPATGWMFDELREIDLKLGQRGMLGTLGEERWAEGKWTERMSWFSRRGRGGFGWGGISDDHLPFLKRGVEILHLISAPFPHVWHTIKDDTSALHLPTIRRWDLIMRLWTAEYLGLQPDLSPTRAGRTDKRDDGAGGEAETEMERPTATTDGRKVERSGGEL